ncbi:MAG: bifunctional nuclease family protein [Candidatus Eisenbacteria sp.]|nr:bifunctional nuclease family protein [Candidatus Eisenbacteria bacterium]
MMVEVVVETLAVDQKNQSPVVILKDAMGERKIPIWIGHPEASVIAMELAGRKFPRPLTHDLIASMLKGLSVRVQRVEISDLEENTFYAKIHLERDGEILCIDARPSDSIAIALKTKAKIYADAKLFSGEIDSLLAGAGTASNGTEAQRAEDLREFIENLDPKDFGKFRF